jgi:uncharacterized protein (DUF2267 family)
MPLGTFLKKIWNGIKKHFAKLPQELKDSIHIGVVVVDAIKAFVFSPEADILTTIIPGDIDDKIKAKLREFLPRIVVEMKLADRCGTLTDPNEILKCAIDTLQTISGDWVSDSAKKNFYDSLAVMIAQVASDGKLDWNDGKTILKWYFDHVYKAPE